MNKASTKTVKKMLAISKYCILYAEWVKKCRGKTNEKTKMNAFRNEGIHLLMTKFGLDKEFATELLDDTILEISFDA